MTESRKIECTDHLDEDPSIPSYDSKNGWIGRWHRPGGLAPVGKSHDEAFSFRGNTDDGFKVCCRIDDIDYAIPLCFASLQDAERAAKAVAEMTEWDFESAESVVEQCKLVGLWNIRKTMMEALAW